jgi:hypothetical protein
MLGVGGWIIPHPIPCALFLDQPVHLAYFRPVMNRRRKKHKDLDLPRALIEELALQKLTYKEAIEGLDVIPDHQTLLRILRRLRLLSPTEKALLEQQAREHALARGRAANN